MAVKTKEKQLVWFEEVGKDNVAEVGGKNANLWEMIRALKNKGIPVPDGFATMVRAYYAFLEANNLTEKIQAQPEELSNKKRKTGLCRQAPSDHSDFVGFLLQAGIDNIPVNPDSVLLGTEKVAETEKKG